MDRGKESHGCISSLVWMDLTRSIICTLDREQVHQVHLTPWLGLITGTLALLIVTMTYYLVETVQYHGGEHGDTTVAPMQIWMVCMLHPQTQSEVSCGELALGGSTIPVLRWKFVQKLANTHNSAPSNCQQEHLITISTVNTILRNCIIYVWHVLLPLDQYTVLAGKFDGELHLAVWPSELKPPN